MTPGSAAPRGKGPEGHGSSVRLTLSKRPMRYKKIGLWLAVATIVVLSNYGTYWATTKVNQVELLEEQIEKLERENLGLLNSLTDGPSK